ncbi:ATP-binding protein [Prolixibacteraceae bacterium Z1-6]|uniref:ATP-binding protein n=1 Tax=Draconibacterium aestuarii TaxID=2998507 RepID=A0A9X3F9Q7_9BACT|nr:ATP-binding protein [Prolixibacteraceae bacterium Z1-6]
MNKMQIAIASGKGGTGKTTVSVNLYYFLSKEFDNQVQLIDCDVEEPNDLLFFPEAQKTDNKSVYSLVPKIDTNKCTFCKKCADWCEFNAITIVKNLKFSEVNTDLCHSCGVCSVACNFNAITEHKKPLGIISKSEIKFGMGIVEGRLEIGSAMQTSLIKKVKKNASNTSQITLFDAPPGTSCPVVETVADANYVILVTEPTPFGVNDLKITVELLFDLNIPFGVIVNKAGLGNDEIYRFLEEKNIELLGKIPFSKSYAGNYSKGELLKNIPAEMQEFYMEIVKSLKTKITSK